MPFALITARLGPDDSVAVGNFLIEMVALDEAIGHCVARYYAEPDRIDEFRQVFVQRMTMRRKLEVLKPILAKRSGQRGINTFQSLDKLLKLRNQIAHSLPSEHYPDDFDPDTDRPEIVYESEFGNIDASELHLAAKRAEGHRMVVALIDLEVRSGKVQTWPVANH